MSSAAKLRKYGRGTATIAAAALVMTSFGPAAFAAWDVAPQGTANTPTGWAAANLPQVEGVTGTGTKIADAELQDDGTIGIVDTAPGQIAGDQKLPARDSVDSLASLDATPGSGETRDENQGATLVRAGADNQAIADVRFTIPNRFRSGDIIDLRLLDRSATENSDGTSNSGPSTSVGFSAVPKVTVSEAQAAGTLVHPDTDNPAGANTESAASHLWANANYAPSSDVRNSKPGVAPKFNVSINQTNGVQGSDNIRLRIDGDPSTGDPTAMWTVTLSDLKVNLGPNVTPGELRVVPFASSRFNNQDSYYATPWFMGNHKNAAVDFNNNPINTVNSAREINTYTVPAYVAPVSVTADNTNIVADGNPQSVGTLSLKETTPYSLTSGTYRLEINGANIANPNSSDIKATLTGGDTGETVTNVKAFARSGSTPAYVEFTYTATTPSRTLASVDVTGLLLTASQPSELQFRFTGAPLTSTWFAPAGYSSAVGSIGSSADLVVQPGTDNSHAWEVAGSTVTGNKVVTPTTATQNATLTGSDGFPSGDYSVTAGTSTGLKISGPGLTIDNIPAGSSFQVQNTNATGAGFASGALATGLVGSSFNLDGVVAGQTITVTGLTSPYDVVERPTQGVSVTQGLAALPEGDYTVAANGDGFIITGPDSLVLGAAGNATNVDNNLAFTFTPGTNGAQAGSAANEVPAGTQLTFSGLADAATFTIESASYDVANGANQKDILAPLDSLLQVGVAVAPSARIGGNNRYETAAKIAEVWADGDKSIVNGKFKNAIIASGENFPDALSASYLSQRMNAPILLVQKNSIPQDTIEALRDRQVDKVFIVGGPAAVSDAVKDRLAALDTYYLDERSGMPADGVLRTTGSKLQTQRLSSSNPSSDNRYTTNQIVNMYAAAWGGAQTIGRTVYKFGQAGKYTAVVARGDNFPDALAAGILTAGVKGSTARNAENALPLILTQPTALSDPAKAQIERLDVQHALIIGSENAVTNDVKKSLEDMGLTNTRIGGADRYFTAAAVDEFAMRNSTGSTTNEYPGLGFLDYTASGAIDGNNQLASYLANGLKFPDALAAAPWIGKNNQVLNLVQPKDVTDGTRDFLTKRAADISRVVALGLGDAVSTAVLDEANKLASAK